MKQDKKIQNQEKVWSGIAPLWKKFRERPMPEVIEFLKDKDGNILDLGCGSGRHFMKLKGKSVIYGVDFSQKMLKLAEKYAKEKRLNVKTIKAYAYKFPLKDNFFDAAIFTATLHCIPHAERRKRALKELKRVLKLS